MRQNSKLKVSQKSTQRTQRNAAIALQYFIVLAIVIVSLDTYSHSSRDSQAMTLESHQQQPGSNNRAQDPLALCTDEEVFQLLAISFDQTVIGYSSKLSTGDAAVYLVDFLVKRGWQYDDSEDSRPEFRAGSYDDAVYQTGAFALWFYSEHNLAGRYKQMMAQFFPMPDGCSIVIELF